MKLKLKLKTHCRFLLIISMARFRHKAAPSDGFVSYLEFNDEIKLRSLLSEDSSSESNETLCDELLHGDTAMEVEEALGNLSEIHAEYNVTCTAYDDDDVAYEDDYSIAFTCHEAHRGAEEAAIVYKKFENFYELNCSSHEHTAWGIYLILYTAFVLFLGCLFKWLAQRLKIPIPYTVMLLCLGIFFEMWEYFDQNSWGQLRPGFNALRKIDPHMILNLFIPGM